MIDEPETTPGDPGFQRPPVPKVALPHEQTEVRDFANTRDLAPVPGSIYGLMAEFDNADTLVDATRAAREKGYKKIEAYTPFPIHEVTEALGFHKTMVPWVVLIGGLTGLVLGFGLQYWTQVIDYPLNVGGRPYNSWPLFVPVTFEVTILFAGLSAVFGMLAMNGLPMPYHPVFNVENFVLASRDRFFLVIEADDPLFDYGQTWSFMESSGAREVYNVPH